MNDWHPLQLKKLKILGAVLELPAKQHCQSSPFTSKLGQIGCSVLLVAPKWLPEFWFSFNCNGCRSFILCENHWDPCVRIFPLNISTIGTVLDLVYLHTSHWRVIIPKSLCPSHKCLQIFFKIIVDSCQILYCKKGNNKWASQGFFHYFYLWE